MSLDTKLVLQMLVEKSFKTGTTPIDLKGELRLMGFIDELINEAITEYFDKFKDRNFDTSLIGQPEPQEPWYAGADESSESHWKKLCGILKANKGWSDEMIESLNESSDSVVSKLANPKFEKKLHVKGLVLGYVQSGKTANYSAVITKALDAGYKFIIVLAGIHNNLRYQTEVRLRQEIIGPSDERADSITRMDKEGDFDGKIAQSVNRILGSADGFGIAVLKKNATVLRKFNNWLEEAKPDVLSDCKILVIDDESDQASINTKKNPELDSTAINKQIKLLIKRFRIASYLGYTATPFANILIDSSIDEDLFPRDFIVALKKPVSYIGAEEIFGSIQGDGEYHPGYPLVRSINQIDEIDNDEKDEDVDSLSTSMKLAIDTFILAGALRLSRGQRKHISMLFHCSHLNTEQSSLHSAIEDYIREKKVAIKRQTEEELEFYKELFNKDFKITSESMGLTADSLRDHELLSNLKLFLENFRIILDNSKSDDRLSFEHDFWGIVVGGNTLSRGLTIEGLTVSYFARSSKMYDSLMQMGRWFGYRPGYLDLKRIFITDKLKFHFYEMATSEISLREELSVMAENNETPLSFRIRVRQHPGMKLTAANKMRTASSEGNSFSGRRALPDFIRLHDSEVSKTNLIAVNSLLKQIKDNNILKSDNYFKMFRTSNTYRGVSKEIVLQFLEDFYISSANSLANKKDILKFILENKNLEDWSVSFFSLIEDGPKFKFDNGDEVILLDRSFSPEVTKTEDPEASYIRGLYLPKDEMIDLRDLYETDDVMKALQNEANESASVAKVRINKRPKNRALLAIYPLSNDSRSKERAGGVYHLKPIKCRDVQFAIMIVFPENKEFGHQKMIVNSTLFGNDKSLKDDSVVIPLNIPSDVPEGRAISIRQPYVEEIFLGKKKYEFRSKPTKIRGRVFIYASNSLGDTSNCKKYKIDPESLQRGKILGSVEIVDCEFLEDEGCYGYKLKDPVRYELALEPISQPQPLFFFPFKK